MRNDHKSGIGGWLILPMIGLFLTPLKLGYLLVTVYLQLFLSGSWSVVTTVGTEAYHPLWAPLILFEIFVNTVLISWAVALLILLFTKSPHFPRWIILYFIASLVFVSLDMAWCSLIPAIAAQNDPTAMKELFRSLFAALVWIPYFIKSERVKNTFTNRLNQTLQPVIELPREPGDEQDAATAVVTRDMEQNHDHDS